MRWRVAAIAALAIGASASAQAPVVPTPHAEAAPIASARSVVLVAAGDLVPNELAMDSVRRAASERDGYHALLRGYGEVLASVPDRAHTITYVNLEVPLVDDLVPLDGGWPRSLPERPRRAPVLGATPLLAPVLAELGVDLVGLANNHAYDQECAGLRRTRAVAEAAGLRTVGAGETPSAALTPVVIERAGLRVAFVSLTTSLNRTARDEPRMYVGRDEPSDAVIAALADARARADLVVVLVHWGRDFLMEEDGGMRALAQRYVDAGADVIFGTGPHVLHRVARMPSARGEALVAFSLGNVASGMGRAYRLGHPPRSFVHPANALPEGRDGAVISVEAARDASGRISFPRVSAAPLWMENDFLDAPRAATVRSVRLADAGPDVCRERMPVVRAALGDEVAIDDHCP